MTRLLAVAILLCGALALAAQPAVIADSPVLLIAQPLDKQTIHDNTGTVEVVVTLEGAAVNAGKRLHVLLDGKPYAEKFHELRFTIHHVDRGEHSLRVELVDQDNV